MQNDDGKMYEFEQLWWPYWILAAILNLAAILDIFKCDIIEENCHYIKTLLLPCKVTHFEHNLYILTIQMHNTAILWQPSWILTAIFDFEK